MNSMRLKGIHLAMRTGMLAAESAFEAVRAGDTSEASLKRYQDKIDAGNLVSSGVDGGTLLTTINALDPIYFTFDVPESLYLKDSRQRSAG